MRVSWRSYSNVRELENLIMRGISFSGGEEIRIEDVGLTPPAAAPRPVAAETGSPGYKEAKQQHLQQFNRDDLGRLLSECGGNVSQAARRCGLSQALQQIVRRYAIRADAYDRNRPGGVISGFGRLMKS
jgi:DNA-binding NtrC family response regulator